MEFEWGPAQSPSASRLWLEVMPPLAATLRERAFPLSVEMEKAISAEIPDLATDPDGVESNRASSEANLRLVADLLERGADPRLVELPAPTVRYAEGGAHQNTPISGLVRAMRVGHECVWHQIVAILREQIDDPDRFAAGVELISAWLFTFVDVVTGLGEEAYARERDRWVRSAAASRAETITAILERTPTDVDAASRRLGYGLERSHLALVAWSDGAEEGQDPVGTLEEALREEARSAGVENPLIHPLGLLAVAGWLGGWVPSEEAPGSGFAPHAGEEAVIRLATGTPGDGIAGFARSHDEAMHARRVAIMAGRPAGSVTRYSEVALTAMATTDLDQAHAFVSAHLGDLLGPDATSTRLIETLAAFLDEGASHGRSANRLGVHENTVRYRVRQAEDILGRPIGPGELDLRVALKLVEGGAIVGGE